MQGKNKKASVQEANSQEAENQNKEKGKQTGRRKDGIT